MASAPCSSRQIGMAMSSEHAMDIGILGKQIRQAVEVAWLKASAALGVNQTTVARSS